MPHINATLDQVNYTVVFYTSLCACLYACVIVWECALPQGPDKLKGLLEKQK